MKVESLTLLNFNRGQTIFKHLLSAFPFKKRNLFQFWIQLFWIDSDKLLLSETFLFWSSISNQVRFFIVNSLFSTLNFFINVANLRFLNCCLSFERFESCHQGKYSRKPSCRRLRVNLLAAKLKMTWLTKKKKFWAGNTKGGSVTVLLTSCLTSLESYENWNFLFLFAKQTNSNQSNRRSMVQWYFPL